MGAQVVAIGNLPLVHNILSDEGSFQGSQTPDSVSPSHADHRMASSLDVETTTKKRKERELPKVDFGSLIQANGLFHLKCYVEAYSKYETVLGQDPYHLTALYRHSVGFWKRGFVNQALATLKQLLSKYPQDAEAWATKGAILIQQSQEKAALIDLKKSVSLDPSLEFIQHVLLKNCSYAFRQIPENETAYSSLPEQEDQALFKALRFASQNKYRPAVQALSNTDISDPESLSSKVLIIFDHLIQDPRLSTQKRSRLTVADLLTSEGISELPKGWMRDCRCIIR
ncbi:MAG: hypothetical protein JSS10_06875 [Verrucomicrobia bacterium]|nr:hypothetical protein [Verrucomicrobiota bacterium]